MDKSSRVIDITEDSSSDYDSAQYINRKVTLYNNSDDYNELSIPASSRKTSVVTIVKRKYEDIIIADSEDEEDTDNNGHQQKTSLSPVIPVVNYSHDRELPLKNMPERLISILLALSSTEQQIRLSAFTKMKELFISNVNLKRHVLVAIEGELGKSSAVSEPCQLAALEVLKGLSWVRCEIGPACLLLLKLISGGAGHVIRCEALITLETIMNQTAIYEIWRTKHENPESFEERDNFDILSKLLQLDLSLCELIFSVLSYLGANDIYKQVRFLAMEIIGKIPGRIRKSILVQSLRKDQIRPRELEKYANEIEEGEIEEVEEKEAEECHNDPESHCAPKGAHNTTKPHNVSKASKNANKTTSSITSLPLLCCGVFAHGIEDQFVQIRFKTLVSLFNIINDAKSSDKFVLNVFLDSLLDECDLIRLAALKYLRRFPGGLQLTVEVADSKNSINNKNNSNISENNSASLESLLAVLDDQNKEIRREALIIIGDNLILTSKINAAVLNETLLRTQKCIEAALLKYPEMEFQVIRAAYKLVHRHSEIIRKTDFWSHLMQCPIPKFMTPTSLLPYSSSNNSTVQAVMQVPLLAEGMRQSRLTRILSRIQDCEVEEKLSLLGIEAAKIVAVPNSSQAARLFNLRVPLDHFNNLQCLYEAAPSDSFYFFENKVLRAYFKLKKLKIVLKSDCDEVRIDEFKMIGSTDHVQLDLIFEDSKGTATRFEPKYDGAIFVAKCPKGLTSAAGFKIYNCNTRAVVHYHAINKL